MNHAMSRRILLTVILMAANLAGMSHSQMAKAESVVQLSIPDAKLGAPAQYGLDRLSAALKANSIQLEREAEGAPQKLVIGTYAGSDQIKKWVDSDGKGSPAI